MLREVCAVHGGCIVGGLGGCAHGDAGALGVVVEVGVFIKSVIAERGLAHHGVFELSGVEDVFSPIHLAGAGAS